MRFLPVAMVAVGVMVAVGAFPALASDPDESSLQQLIPGVALEEDELSTVSGMGTTTSIGQAEISNANPINHMRIRNRILKARRTNLQAPDAVSARNAARKAYGGLLPRISSSLDGEVEFFSERVLGF